MTNIPEDLKISIAVGISSCIGLFVVAGLGFSGFLVSLWRTRNADEMRKQLKSSGPEKKVAERWFAFEGKIFSTFDARMWRALAIGAGFLLLPIFLAEFNDNQFWAWIIGLGMGFTLSVITWVLLWLKSRESYLPAPEEYAS